MKLTLEWGRKGKHSQAAQNESLLAAVGALSKELAKAKGRIAYLEDHNEQIVAELNRLIQEKREGRERLRANRQAMDAVTRELPVVTNVVPFPPVKVGRARFQLVKGGRIEP